MKNLLIKISILSIMLFVGFAMATTPPTDPPAKKEKTVVSCVQHAPTQASSLPANLPSWCNPQKCAPANCQPADCNPANCKPANCKPANCKPANCKPANCKSEGALH